MNHAGIEAHVAGLEFDDLASAHTGADAGEEAKREERNELTALVALDVGHQVAATFDRKGLG